MIWPSTDVDDLLDAVVPKAQEQEFDDWEQLLTKPSDTFVSN
ncbi:uncharacterized protein YmfQ (DUF2313 family) [Arthrobacter stackebrandtii]|uniref:Uncharacterized protein YmfQ (DUF2313 family) n=1 Tax=Arthrobacter stackebrandtii TaxID=272161 RepID=A0ABS4YZ73_9MICC|nr:hypothetical protein [Arthrobacter stackebrandtii]MBP2414036.1 uncharacterized protein YmfQ (DUF2313 family) [Arthrobacter stackebrandtii]